MSQIECILKKYNPYIRDKITNKFNYYNLNNVERIEDSHFYKNLVNEIIYFSDPTQFNDENEFLFDFKYSDWNFKGHIKKEEFEKLKIKLINILQKETKSKFGVFCLAPNSNDDYFWNNEKWYVKNYNGVCCEYDIEKIIMENSTKIMFKSVVYCNEKVPYRPEYVSHYDQNDEVIPKSILKIFNSKPEEAKKAGILTMNLKPSVWSREQEQRMIILNSNHDGNVLCQRAIHAVPTKIFLGKNVAEKNVDIIIQLCKSKNIQLYKMRNDTLEFDLVQID